MLFKSTLITALYISTILAEIEHNCSDMKRSEIELHLSTKTPYRVVAKLDESKFLYPECKATRIWSVIRHGARNPSKKIIRKAKENLTRIRQRILNNARARFCPHEIAMFKFWYFNVSTEEEKFLVAEGEDEQIELAERMQNRFPDLLKDTYDPDLYLFKYTATQRTLKSAQSFATGLFGRHRIRDIEYPEALHKDPVLRFYKLCQRWKADVDKNPESLDYVRKFVDGPEMHEVVKYIKQRTQLNDITPQDAHLMYTICAFETAWNKHRKVSPWCSVFNRKTIQLMEFAEDLEYYWIDGYGFEITHKQACPAIIDMFDHIDPNSLLHNATFYFTHSGTMLKLLAHLGLYKDEFHLTHKDVTTPRLWRTSAIDSFSSNLAFVLYECSDEPKVLTLHQERVVRIPGCPQDQDLCNLKQLRSIFKNSIERCDFNEMCNIPK